MDKWIIIHPTHLLPNPFMTQPAHLPPLIADNAIILVPIIYVGSLRYFPSMKRKLSYFILYIYLLFYDI